MLTSGENGYGKKKGKNVCSVPGCGNKFLPLYRFPDPAKRLHIFQQWVRGLNNPQFKNLLPMQIYKRGFVCHKHFVSDDFIVGTRKLLHTAVPTINLPPGKNAFTFFLRVVV